MGQPYGGMPPPTNYGDPYGGGMMMGGGMPPPTNFGDPYGGGMMMGGGMPPTTTYGDPYGGNPSMMSSMGGMTLMPTPAPVMFVQETAPVTFTVYQVCFR